jgi:hypothetical protein
MQQVFPFEEKHLFPCIKRQFLLSGVLFIQGFEIPFGDDIRILQEGKKELKIDALSKSASQKAKKLPAEDLTSLRELTSNPAVCEELPPAF